MLGLIYEELCPCMGTFTTQNPPMGDGGGKGGREGAAGCLTLQAEF